MNIAKKIVATGFAGALIMGMGMGAAQAAPKTKPAPAPVVFVSTVVTTPVVYDANGAIVFPAPNKNPGIFPPPAY